MPVRARSWTEADQAKMSGFRERLPEHLYRYVGVRGRRLQRLEDIVVGSELYFPAYSTMNDPFEGAVPFDFAAEEREVREYWMDHLVETGQGHDPQALARVEEFVAHRDDPAYHARWKAEITDEAAGCGLSCFSETCTDIPMWAYSAEGHQGVCLCFRTALLFGPGWNGCFPPMPVTYEPDFPVVSFYRASEFDRGLALLATKSEAWRHEREWRIVRNTGAGAVRFDSSALDGIVLGCKMQPADQAAVQGILARRSPPIQRLTARRDDRAYRLLAD